MEKHPIAAPLPEQDKSVMEKLHDLATRGPKGSTILGAMQHKHVYAGTVSEKEALRRLAKKKQQRVSRRKNRR